VVNADEAVERAGQPRMVRAIEEDEVGEGEKHKRASLATVIGQVARAYLRYLSATSPFDRLPDELVSLVLSFVYAVRIGFPWSRPTLLLNKRCRRLTESAADEWFIDDDTAPSLFRQPHLLRLLRRAHCPLPCTDDNAAVTYLSLLLPFFTGLTSFSVEGSSPEIYTVFSDALNSLKHLKSLRLAILHVDDDWRFEDESFTLGELRSLERLELGRCGCVEQLLRSTPSSLQHLELDAGDPDDNPYRVLPWSTLCSLRLDLGRNPGEESAVQQLNESLSKALLPDGVGIVSIFTNNTEATSSLILFAG
jgi:hypothetical protein